MRQWFQNVFDLVDLEHLESEPSLYAGGLSMMFRDDFLNPHIDNSHDAKRDRNCRALICYSMFLQIGKWRMVAAYTCGMRIAQYRYLLCLRVTASW
jgi:hypothetical protein